VRLTLARERLELPDGDFIDLDWTEGGPGSIVVLLHGLEGSARSSYATGLLSALRAQGWRGVLMYFRGCSGSLNRLPRAYHSGDTGDLAYLLATLRARHPKAKIAAVGFSLGGNVLLKYLGERRAEAQLCAAVAVGVPFVLADAADRLEHGFSRVYQLWLLRSLRRKVREKRRRGLSHIDLDRLDSLRSFWAFDDAVTAPLHGFAGADDYYTRSSSRQYLRGIAVPTLILHSADDPFMTSKAIPAAAELSPTTRLELSARGGHGAFVAGPLPGLHYYWLDRRIPEFLAPYLFSAT
jgi:predicted alpha/beta-fold hydrolase